MERDNKGRFVKGHKQLNSGRTRFQKGQAIRKGAKHSEESKKKMSEAKKGIMPANIKQLKNSYTPLGEEHCSWKGDDVGYSALHKWVYKHKGKAEVCEHCGGVDGIQWANKSHEYKRDLEDWLSLCKPCHGKYDSGENWGKATEKYVEINKKAQ